MSRQLEVVELSKKFPGRDPLFEGLSMQVDEGSFHIIRGRSGSGKSTLLQIIMGFENYDQGQIFFEGKNLKEMLRSTPLHYQKSIGYMIQNNILLPELNILDNITLGIFEEFEWRDRVEKAFNILDLLGIRHLHNRYINEISGGELRRANLALAIINRPKILLLDEPTSNLHSELAKEIFSLIGKLSKEGGMTVIMSTHDRSLRIQNGHYYEIENQKMVNRKLG